MALRGSAYTRNVSVLLLLGITPILLSVVVVIVAELIDRLRETRRHARILTDLGEPLAATTAVGITRREVATVEGKLAPVVDAEAERAQLVSFHPYGTSFLDEANVYAVTHASIPTSFAVELDGGGRVILDGQSQVLRGTMETEHTAPLDQAPALDAEPLARAKVGTKRRVGQFRVLRPGDRVRARGAIEPAPDDDALYRGSSSVKRMTPAPTEAGEPKIILAAVTSRRRRLTPRRGLLPIVGAAAVVGGLAAVAAGAMSLPTRLSAQLSPQPTPAVQATKEPPTCRAEALASLESYGLSDRAAVDCDDDYTRAMAHYASGNFAAASEAFTAAAQKDPSHAPSLAEVEAHLFVHSFDKAAVVVRRMDEQFYPGPSTAEKRHLECIIGVLDERAKRRAPGPRFVKVCATRPFAKLARQLDSEGRYHGEDDWPRPTYQKETSYDAVNLPYTAVVATRARLTARPIALERDLLDRILLEPGLANDPFGKLRQYVDFEAEAIYPILTTWAAELVLFYAYAGFPERSAPYWPILDHVAKVLESGGTFHENFGASPEEKKKLIEDQRTLLRHVMSVAGAAAFYSDDAARMTRYTNMGEPYSSQATRQLSRIVQGSAPWEDPVVDRDWPEHKAVFDAAATGHSAEVVRVLTAQRSSGRTTLARALRRLSASGPADREPLIRWFRGGSYPSACLTCGASTYLGDISDRREVARLLGEVGERDRLRLTADRFATALTDPELGFELDELETFFSRKK